jgi:hypothetical protein
VLDELVEQPGKKLRVFVVAVLAMKGLAEVPVRGVDQAHTHGLLTVDWRLSAIGISPSDAKVSRCFWVGFCRSEFAREGLWPGILGSVAEVC